MAKVKSKGGLLRVTISAVLTTVLQCTDINIGSKANRMLDAECIDDSGVAVEMLNDGAVTQEQVTATVLYDPDSTVHQFITDTIDLGAASFPIACSVVFADTTPASATFNAGGFGFGVGMAVKGLLTGNITITPTGLVTYPT
jgi:hypothetical protein